MKKHIALIIGPVIPTIFRARYTRELWASSYMFSYLMKKIIGKLRTEKEIHFILPFAQGEESESFFRDYDENYELLKKEKDDTKRKLLERHLLGAGLFPDQFILQTDKTDGYTTVKEIVRHEIVSFARKTAAKINPNIPDNTEQEKFEAKVISWFKAFFRIYLIERDLEDDQNPIEEMTRSLAICELREIFPLQEEDFLSDLLEQSPGSFLATEAFGGRRSFDTLLEVAVRDFEDNLGVQNFQHNREHFWKLTRAERKKAEEQDEKLIINTLSEKYTAAFRPAHKYVAIVHADGDGVGALIKGLKTSEQFAHFSKTLKMFALEAVERIKTYGGVPVYAGGDDLLFFAPAVRDSLGSNIFHLLEDLNQCLKTHFKDFSVIPTLSFGVSISFYKFPLYEALETSRDLLFQKAKQYKPRNAIAFKVRKHSGHEFGALLPMQSAPGEDAGKKTVFRLFMDMLKDNIQNPDRTLSSINYHIRSNAGVYHQIGMDAERVENFVSNCFDESVHTDEDAQQYLGDIKTLLPAVFKLQQGDPDKAANMMYALLRTADFLTQNEPTSKYGNP